jgi:hypothetical protein
VTIFTLGGTEMLQFWARKTGQKKKAEPNIEFVSPYPVEDCVWQLENFPGIGERFPVKTVSILLPINAETWQFAIEKSYYRIQSMRATRPLLYSKNDDHEFTYIKLSAVGTLKSMPSYETLVVGTVYLNSPLGRVRRAISFMIACIVLAITITLFGDAPFLSLIIFVGVLMPIIYWGYVALPNANHFSYMLASDIKRLLQN